MDNILHEVGLGIEQEVAGIVYITSKPHKPTFCRVYLTALLETWTPKLQYWNEFSHILQPATPTFFVLL